MPIFAVLMYYSWSGTRQSTYILQFFNVVYYPCSTYLGKFNNESLFEKYEMHYVINIIL